jgi:putative colanic acid biosynthesis UDP-glucose lipid carrier transferase
MSTLDTPPFAAGGASRRFRDDVEPSESSRPAAPARFDDGLHRFPAQTPIRLDLRRIPPEGRQLETQTPPVRAEDLRRSAQRAGASRLKRLIDVAGALCGLILLAPLLGLIAALIRLESPGPALFRQRRTGLGGAPFQIYKFRTMRVAEDGAEIVQASRGDCRVTPLGALLRQSCFDELPQLFNVLKGEMSLVGPRPHALAHDGYYGALIPSYQSRFLVRPGISGLAQVSGFRGQTPNVEAMAGRIDLDLEYIRRWSVALDLRILLQTAFEGPFHPAAY